MLQSLKLPQNLDSRDAKRFEMHNYRVPEVQVREVAELFCTADGICLKNFILIAESLHNYIPVRRKFWVRALRSFFASRVLQRAKSRRLRNDRLYLLIHHPWLNYYHWLLDCLPRLRLVEQRLSELTLVLPESYMKVPYVQQSLACFQFAGVEYVPHAESFVLPNAVIPQIRPESRLFSCAELQWLLHRLCGGIQAISKYQSIDRIFISRQKGTHRKLQNALEVQEYFLKEGFQILELESMSLADQIHIFSAATHVAGLHGAGFSNLIFAPESCRVFEFLKKATRPSEVTPDLYWFLASAMHQPYYYQFCAPQNFDEHYVSADVMVDLQLLEKNLKVFLSLENPG